MVFIPEKRYFKIGEVKNITGVEPHVLRYWESEFRLIRPQRASSRQRLYRQTDIRNILMIKKLLQEDGYSISGARKYLAASQKETTAGREVQQKKQQQGQKDPELQVHRQIPAASREDKAFFSDVRAELMELKRLLEEK